MLADEQYLSPGEYPVPGLVAALLQGFGQWKATGYPARQMAHGGGGGGFGKILQGKFLLVHGALNLFFG